jgi:putative FmdB family regulatory protein
MPLFEFICTECQTTFEQLIRISRSQSDVVCPACQSTKTQKQLSGFAVSSGASTASRAAAACAPGGT